MGMRDEVPNVATGVLVLLEALVADALLVAEGAVLGVLPVGGSSLDTAGGLIYVMRLLL
jgi:hypothetical protein